ncbi:replication initiation factor domain-containing protein [Carnobacterium divergens]|uniref:Replication initiation factor domain-containing protein n=1 Tax=Carnobacterium divergens TaxID=2748 RepID=A0AAW8RE03_CARDV|nr:replication initiation factor domain-containing protein [Carnobacterium divergens]MDT1959051.1 replication initiation factor domain-containing protein [Carnobacterium divergens]MDT1975160.1 replication initiation factor domain-containing protein [Carnobacterium divergens]
MNAIDLKEVGQSAKLTREQHGWTQKDVAEKIGISRSLLAKFESGTRNLSEDTLNRLLDYLQTPTEEEPTHQVIIDYLTIHFFSCNYQKLIEDILGIAMRHLEFYESAPLGYIGRYTWNNVINILISADDPNKGILIELSGQGCRRLAMLLKTRKRNWKSFIQQVFDYQGNFTRIDFTLDDYVGMLDIPTLAKKIDLGHVQTNFRNSDLIHSKNIASNDSNGTTLYLGSKKSLCHFCWYQKNYEQRKRRGIPLEDAEIINRYELRYRKEKAQQLAEKILNYPDFATLFFELVNAAICFYDRSPEEPDAKIDAAWAAFINEHNKVVLTLETSPQTFEKSISWLLYGVAPTLSFIHAVDQTFHSSLLNSIIENATMNPRQKKILENMESEPQFYHEEIAHYSHQIQEILEEKAKQ